MSDPHNFRDSGLRAKPARSPSWAREASVFVWLIIAALLLLGLLLLWL